MDANWSRIWMDFRITICFLGITILLGLGFVTFQSVGSRSIALLASLSSLATGGLIGFLFGIPRVLQDNNSAPIHEPVQEGADRPAYRMQVNTNLEQISDWLTKIIVGFGLIQLQSIPEHLRRLSLFVAGGMGLTPGTQVFALSIIVYFFVIGFLSGYLMTRIYLAQAFSRADWGAQNTIVVAGTELTLSEVSEQSRVLLADLQNKVMSLQTETPASRASRIVEIGHTPEATSVSSILWVDDNPKNNIFLVERLQKQGISVVAVPSTSDALSAVKRRSFDRIISDMGRLEPAGYNKTAGLDLLRQLRASDIQTQVAFYCSNEAVAKYGSESYSLGATIITSSPTDLLKALEIKA